MSSNLGTVRALLRALERGDLPALLDCYTPDAVQIEMPNALKPRGDRRGVARLAADFERGAGLLTAQTYHEVRAVESGDDLMMELRWSGTLAVDFGRLGPGDTMKCTSVMCFAFAGGKIAEQRNYDCFEPF